ncbi:ATP-binding cassette domain-containing protein [Tistrella mobilis]|uniref:ABC transporter ATP-binding protein n=2 Tax=Tistrella mobilis TaxID=171437 RepID=A0A161R1E5_9PROT|nr:ATP-binding cassette domain-containing protein [Tistrella mobilis]KYO51230.1 cobalt ABC transporter ATP-binding protein [Tistrella mobilis]
MLEARGLVHHYPGGVTALDHVDLAIPAGGRLAILGANGAGKSTLLLALAGAIRTDQGQVVLDGTPVTHDRKGLTRLRHRVGLVFQDPDDQLFAATVAEDVSFGPLNLGLTAAEARERTAEALAMMGVAHLADRATHMLSFGQRKRVAIAGLLAMRPGILLLDEPTAGLDPAGVDELMQRLDAVAGTGTAVVIATHDMDLANGWADRVAVFGRGRIVLDGAPDTVFEDEVLLSGLGLRLPMLRRLASALASRGLLPAGPLPRRLEDLVAALPSLR